MRAISEFQGIYIHREPIDLRKAVNGLSALVQDAQMGDLMGPNLFVFTGKRRNVLKILYFDKCGFALWYKRLEESKFPWSKSLDEAVVKLTPTQLEWLLSGYDVWKMKPFNELRFECFS